MTSADHFRKLHSAVSTEDINVRIHHSEKIKGISSSKQQEHVIRRVSIVETCHDFSVTVCGILIDNDPENKCPEVLMMEKISTHCPKTCGLCSEGNDIFSESDEKGAENILSRNEGKSDQSDYSFFSVEPVPTTTPIPDTYSDETKIVSKNKKTVSIATSTLKSDLSYSENIIENESIFTPTPAPSNSSDSLMFIVSHDEGFGNKRSSHIMNQTSAGSSRLGAQRLGESEVMSENSLFLGSMFVVFACLAALYIFYLTSKLRAHEIQNIRLKLDDTKDRKYTYGDSSPKAINCGSNNLMTQRIDDVETSFKKQTKDLIRSHGGNIISEGNYHEDNNCLRSRHETDGEPDENFLRNIQSFTERHGHEDNIFNSSVPVQSFRNFNPFSRSCSYAENPMTTNKFKKPALGTARSFHVPAADPSPKYHEDQAEERYYRGLSFDSNLNVIEKNADANFDTNFDTFLSSNMKKKDKNAFKNKQITGLIDINNSLKEEVAKGNSPSFDFYENNCDHRPHQDVEKMRYVEIKPQRKSVIYLADQVSSSLKSNNRKYGEESSFPTNIKGSNNCTIDALLLRDEQCHELTSQKKKEIDDVFSRKMPPSPRLNDLRQLMKKETKRKRKEAVTMQNVKISNRRSQEMISDNDSELNWSIGEETPDEFKKEDLSVETSNFSAMSNAYSHSASHY